MLSATKLRQNLYQILDEVARTGVPVEVERAGRIIRITAVEPASKWDRLDAHDTIRVDPASLVELDWSSDWDPDAVS